MERIGVLVACYGSREAAIIDSLCRSEKYRVEVFAADKQQNPFISERAKKHVVIPDFNIDDICKFTEKNKNELDFAIISSEGPIIDGARDLIEKKTNIPVICPIKDYALENSKVRQRLLLQEVIPEANPQFKIFSPEDYVSKDKDMLIGDIKRWINTLGGVDKSVIKPDRPGFGKGVGVGGEHFNTLEEAFEHFNTIYGSGEKEKVIIEEKIDGEESSFQAFCDGKSLISLPDTRDNKRAFDADRGPNTGGTGSYKDTKDFLPFMAEADREKEITYVNKIFNKLRGKTKQTGLRGMPFYVAFTHTADEPKILEINSRPGDPEIINILPLLKDDFAEICFKMIEGNLTKADVRGEASVVTYAMPMTYGNYRHKFSGETRVDLTEANKLSEKHGDNIRIYPGSMEYRDDNQTYALKSRTVATVGIGANLDQARKLSLDGITRIDGPLWNRWDIASDEHISKSINHLKQLRQKI